MPDRSRFRYQEPAVQSDDDPLGLMHADLELDWELQRLLGEEINAMEPASGEPVSRESRLFEPASAIKAHGESSVPPISSERTLPASDLPSPSLSIPSSASDARVEQLALALSENLSLEIDALYQQLAREVGSRRAHLEEVSALLQRARDALLTTPPAVSEAEKWTMQAHALLRQREDSRRWGATYGALILGYEFLFFVGFVAVLAFDRPLAGWVSQLTGLNAANSMRDIIPFWDTMIWGGIGGVLGALYSLYWHVTELQDFDRQFNMWYVVQPVMGAMLGAFIYLIVLSGMLAMNTNFEGSALWFPSALACLCGFRQKFIFELLDKLVEVIGLRPLLKRTTK